MNTTQQPEALRLAEWIESDMSCDGDAEIVAELRRLHTRVQELEAAQAQRVPLSEVMNLVSEWGMASHASGEAALVAHNLDATPDEIAYADECMQSECAAWKAIEDKLCAHSITQAVPDEGLHKIRLLLRVAKNQINKATMTHAISVVQDELEKVATHTAPQPAAHGMKQDAARYQALVESGNFAPSPFDNGMWGLRVSSVPSTKAELDAAVDRVIAAQAKQGGHP